MKNPFGTEEESVSSTATSLMTGVLSAVDSANAGGGEGGHGDDADENGEVKAGYGNMDSIPKPKINFLKDDVKEMTYGRRIALKLMDKPWYNPMCKEDEKEEDDEKDGGSNNPNKTVEEEEDSVVKDFDEDVRFEEPCLAKGWAFFEHQSLYRYILPVDYEDKPETGFFTRTFRTLFMHRNKKFQKAEPGEDDDPSRLYPSFVPHKQLGDFGLGIGLYFSNLRALIFITLICGFISLGNIIYYGSDEYDNVDYVGENYFTTLSLRASAACSSQAWVPCPECDCKDSENSDWFLLQSGRCANAIASDGITELRFALKNNCDGTKLSLAATNFATVVFMVISSLLLGLFMRRDEVKFDEDEQTAQDYSVQIKNPPSNANDPEEWRRFFNKNFDGAQVTVCTCAVDNDLLVKALVKRRESIRNIHSLQPGHSLDMLDLTKAAAEIERSRNLFGRLKAKAVPGIPEHVDRLVALRGKIEGQAQLEHSVSNVFLTFETEEGQRGVLEKLSVGYTKAKNNDASALSDRKYLFRGEFVLDVCEPEEPSTIRWQDLNAGLHKIVKQQVYTTFWTIVALVVVTYVIYFINKVSAAWATYSITIFNVLFPIVAKLMTNNLETHASESNKQASLYYKIVLFRWVSTTLIFYMIIPFSAIISYGEHGLLKRIYLQFQSDIIVGNAIPLLDPMGHFQRHFLAPRAKSQDSMNILFRGSPYELAERYTDMTKILFLCLFYSSIFPISFFLCAISLTLKYFVDRFNMVRTWKRAPALGPVISSVSRRYFMSLAVAVMAIACSYYWTGFPYDNLCPNEDSSIDTSYVGTFNVSNYPKGTPIEGVETITVTADDVDYRFCNMDYTVGRFFSFPFVPTQENNRLDPGAYMTDDQIISTTYFGWSAFAILILVLCKYLYILVWNISIKKISGGYKAVGKSQGIPFSEVDSRCAYIPQVNSDAFAFPLIACRIDDIDEEMFDFKDPDRPYKYYDLTMDAKKLLAAKNIANLQCFTIVKTWAPEKND